MIVKPRFETTYNLTDYKTLYHLAFSTVKKLYNMSNSEEEFIENIKKYKEEKLNKKKPESQTKQILNEVHKEFPLIPINTISNCFYENNHDVDKVRELLRKRIKNKITQDHIMKIAQKHNISYGTFVRRYKSIFGLKQFILDDVTEENLKTTDIFYRNKRYADIIRNKMHEYAKTFKSTYHAFSRVITHEFFDDSLNNLNCENDKEFDILMSDIDYFINDNYGQSTITNSRTLKRIDTFKKGGQIIIPGYKNLKEYYKKAVKGKISYSYLTVLRKESDTLEEFLQKVKESIDESEKYSKEKFKEVSERIRELSKKFGLKESSIKIMMLKYGINKHDLVNDPSLFIIVERILNNRRAYNKK